MKDQIKSVLSDHECIVVKAEARKNCYYVRHVNRDREDLKNYSDKVFSNRIINLFKKSRKLSHNHYFVDMNNIDINEVIRFSQYHAIPKRDFSNDLIINLGGITNNIVEEAGCEITRLNGEWIYNIDCGFDILIFNAQDLHMYQYSRCSGFDKSWIKSLLDEEFQSVTRAIESDRYKGVGSTKIHVEYTTTVKDVFMIHPEKYHVLVNTKSEVV